MNELQVFNNSEFGSVRTTEINGKTYFVAKDVADALGYSNTRDAVARHCKGVVKRDVPHPQSEYKTIEVSFIPEGDIYRLVIKSQLPAAEKFESWIFDEVIPQIRKTGSYNLPQTYSQALEQLLIQVKENEKLLEANETMKPKADYFDALVDRKLNVSFTDCAKELGIQRKDFMKYLRDNNYIYRGYDGNYRPYSQYAEHDKGYFVMKDVKADNGYVTVQTLVTPKGKEAFNMLINQLSLSF